jgi:hypothetical protein
MKRLSLTILCCFLLSGCVFDPVFDTSSWDAYQRSSAAIKAKLSSDDLRRLDVALNYLLVEGLPRIETSGQFLKNVTPSVALANPNIILIRLAPRIDGRNAATVIADLSARLNAEISSAEARLQGTDSGADSVEVFSPIYYWRRSGYLEQPVVEFAVRNAGKVPISRIYFNCALITPNRSIPWARQQFVYTFKGGLEPREKLTLTLQQHNGEWSDPQLKDLVNAQLKVVVINYEDANGVRMIAVDRDRLSLEREVRASLQ